MTRLSSLWRLWRLRHVQREIEVAELIRRVMDEEMGVDRPKIHAGGNTQGVLAEPIQPRRWVEEGR